MQFLLPFYLSNMMSINVETLQLKLTFTLLEWKRTFFHLKKKQEAPSHCDNFRQCGGQKKEQTNYKLKLQLTQ